MVKTNPITAKVKSGGFVTRSPVSSIRDGIGKALIELARSDQRVVVLSADLTNSTRTHWFKQQFPDRFFDIGVAEQNMAGIAAGLALAGKIPFIASYGTFSPGINWGTLRSSVCYSSLPVKIISGHNGLATGADGATHQALEDIALMRTLPNMTVVAPADGTEAFEVTMAAAKLKGPVYIRSVKPKSKPIQFQEKFELGKGRLVQAGETITIFAHGLMLQIALKAAEILKEKKITAQIVDLHTIKPLDKKIVEKAFVTTRAVLCIEDHQRAGGLGSTIAEFISTKHYKTPYAFLGVNNQFGESGSMEDLYQKHGLTAENIVHTLLKLIKK